jgi:hypothetical protein
MNSRETLLEMAQRHVAEGEARVTHQTALVAELARDGRNTVGAEAELATLKRTQGLMCEVLAREREREAKVRQRQGRRGW